MTNQIAVSIASAAWFDEKNNYMMIPSALKSFFPLDCFIPRGTGRENKDHLIERGIDLVYQGQATPVRCFLEVRDNGVFRPSNRGAIKAFYAHTKPKVGDQIVFVSNGSRSYTVALLRA